MDYDFFYTVIPGYLNPKNPAFKKNKYEEFMIY